MKKEILVTIGFLAFFLVVIGLIVWFGPNLREEGVGLSPKVQQQFDGHIIVRLKTPSVIEEKIRLDKTTESTKAQLDEHRNKVKQEQSSFRNSFRSISDKGRIVKTFENVLNAVVIKDVTKEELNKIKNLQRVQSVSPNLEVHATLMDSVPLINADDVWRLNEQGGQCAGHCANQEKTFTRQQNSLTGRVVRNGVAPNRNINICPNGVYIPPSECLTGKGVTIGIIDTGVDYTHPDLGGCFGVGCKVVDGWDFINDQNYPIDDHGHGTHVAATAAGDGVLKGVAPDASIVAYKALDSTGHGSFGNIIAAIERSADPNQDGDFSDHLDVISLSLGTGCMGYSVFCGPDDPQSLAIDNVVSLGVVAVIAAGNDGYFDATINSPGTARKAITVGAVNKQLNIASFSSRGPVIWDDNSSWSEMVWSLIKPDIVAPGVSICAAKASGTQEGPLCLDNQHISLPGTSMATPHVSGLAALIKQGNPNYTPGEIKSIIKNTAILIPNPEKVTTEGLGIVDALQASLLYNPIDVSLGPLDQNHSLINITGTIVGNNFEHYELAYALDLPLKELNEGSWNLINSSNILPIDNMLHLNFDTDIPPLNNGQENLIRLRVYDTSGRVFEDYGYFGFSIYGGPIP